MSETFLRFSVRQRAEHLFIMLVFIVLAVTGFPQKFFDADWARWTVSVLGGIDRIRWLHRMSGVLFAMLTAVHLSTALVIGVTGRSWSIVPIRKDFTDAVETLRYYLGLTDRPARFDRFDYRQKFEYWGMVLGGAVMSATGFVLYFPVLLARVVPGEIIPAAKVAHSNEGLLAFLVVITWHIYNAHLSPDVFPFDTSIFTGRISGKRLHHEHPLEYERLVGRKHEV
jgi:formate dehydrogenase subunit gamma